jgi:hypothetical protein
MTETPAQADLIAKNGRIYTVDGDRSWASAIAVRSGRIIAIGDEAAVKPHVGSETKIVDLGGRMVMPGIVDVHTHMMMGGQAELFELRFSNILRRDAILKLVREAAEKTPEGKWVIGAQWGSDLISILNTEDSLKALDEASLGRPVMLRDDTYHNRWVNTAAMKLAGVDKANKDPDQGSFGRDPKTGALTGVMIESAAGLIERTIVASGHYSEEMDRAAMARSIATLNSYGVTAFLDAAAMQPVMAALKGLDDRGQLTAWAAAAMPVTEPSFMFGIAGEALFATRETYRSKHVNRISLKSSSMACPARAPPPSTSPTRRTRSSGAASAARRLRPFPSWCAGSAAARSSGFRSRSIAPATPPSPRRSTPSTWCAPSTARPRSSTTSPMRATLRPATSRASPSWASPPTSRPSSGIRPRSSKATSRPWAWSAPPASGPTRICWPPER